MRIHPPKRGRPPFLNQRDQFRMLTMVGLLTLVIIAARVAARPSSWYWLTGVPAEQSQQATGESEIDFTVETTRPLNPDEFFASIEEGDSQAQENSTPNSADAGQSGAATQAQQDGAARQDAGTAHDAPAATETEAPRPAESPGPPPANLDAENVFSVVEDNTLGVRQQEAGVHDMLLARAAELSSAQQAGSSLDDVSFTVLMLEPDRFRGELITIRGRVKRVVELPVAANRFGIERMYEAWIFTRDSGTNPYRFVFTKPPVDVPLAENIEGEIDVTATGYFFKRYGYASEGGMHVAPLLLGSELKRNVPREIIPVDAGFARYVIAAVLIGLAVLTFALWRINRSDRKFYEGKLRPLSAPADTSLAPLQGRADESAREMLGRMQQEDETQGSTGEPPAPSDSRGESEPS